VLSLSCSLHFLLTLCCVLPFFFCSVCFISDEFFGALAYGKWVQDAVVPSCPQHSVLIWAQTDAVCIDQYENYVVQVMPDGSEQPWPINISPDTAPDSAVFRAKCAPAVLPQAYISANKAQKACAEAGKYLCSRREFEAGCRGATQGFVYPYGNTYQAHACNEGRPVNPIIELFGPHATFNFTEMNGALVLRCVGRRVW
jgi:hypothetical protein